MYEFPLDHLQRLVVILYYYMSPIDICVELSKTKTDRQAFSLSLEECSAMAIFTCIGLLDKGLCAVIICQSGPEKHVTNPGLQAVKILICGGVPVQFVTCFLRKVVLDARPGRKSCK